MDPMKFNQTRDGRKARVLCTDRIAANDRDTSIVALISAATGEAEFVVYRRPDGSCAAGRQMPGDLIYNDPLALTKEEKRVLKVAYLAGRDDGVFRGFWDKYIQTGTVSENTILRRMIEAIVASRPESE